MKALACCREDPVSYPESDNKNGLSLSLVFAPPPKGFSLEILVFPISSKQRECATAQIIFFICNICKFVSPASFG